MTQPQSVQVDPQEILSRASEVEAPMAVPPTDVPAAPNGLTIAINATEQIKLNAENMRMFLETGVRERARLAASLRNAAKQYGAVDEESAEALNNDGGEVSEEIAGGVGGDESAGLQDTPDVVVAGDSGYNDIEATAKKLEAGDQAASLSRMAEGWNKLSFAMQADVKRFRIFQGWEGEAAEACEASLDQQHTWVTYMAANASALAKQADFMAQAQSWARNGHPSSAAIKLVRDQYQANPGNKAAMDEWAAYQKKSEEVMTQYNTKVSDAIKAINPEKPPKAIKIDPPPPPQTPGLIPTQFMQVASMAAGGGGQGMQAPMMPPTGAGAGGGMPAGVGADLASMRESVANLSKEPGMKPMSLGGGGGGGMPAMPLAEASGAGGIPGDSVRPAGAGDIGGAGQGGAAGRGAAGGGGMGMPMGGHGQGGGGSKSKGAQQDDEALYTEDREWTEAVIGQRRRQDMKESK